jgi:glutamate/tyrosine decarboxylase-like PLP-dependent enzyme
MAGFGIERKKRSVGIRSTLVWSIRMNTSASLFLEPLTAALTHAIDHLCPKTKKSVAATATLDELRSRLCSALSEEGTTATQVIDDLVAAVEGGIHDSAGPKFFGWVIGGSLPAALSADWLTSAWDQNAALYACSPAAAVVEEVVGQWLKELLPVAPEASFALVTGAQMAHVTCLAAARHALLRARGIDPEIDGLQSAPAIRILTSSEIHGSIVRAVRLLGMGEKNLMRLAVKEDGTLTPQALETALAKDPSAPTIVILQAGDLNIGAFDDFQTLIPMAHRHDAWVHIDGAFGLWARVSSRFKHLLDGVGAADSWTTDGHKWLNVPYDSGYAFIRNREAHRSSVSHRAVYLTHDTDARDQIDWTPEWSRRGRGFATYAALRQLGKTGVAQLIERTCACAHALVTRIGALPGAEVVWKPTINQGLVRFLHPGSEAQESDHDAFTEIVIARILASGRAFFTGTTWRGRRAMRISVCNWQTSLTDVAEVVEGVADVLREARG